MNTEVAQRGLGRNQTIKLRNQSGQYRNAVASGESQNADNCLILEDSPDATANRY